MVYGVCVAFRNINFHSKNNVHIHIVSIFNNFFFVLSDTILIDYLNHFCLFVFFALTHDANKLGHLLITSIMILIGVYDLAKRLNKLLGQILRFARVCCCGVVIVLCFPTYQLTAVHSLHFYYVWKFEVSAIFVEIFYAN